MSKGEHRIKCPYCGDTFNDVYYFNFHVPCPNPKGDVPEPKKETSDE